MYNIAIIEDELQLRRELSDYFEKSSRVNCVMAVDTVEKFVKFHRDFLEIDFILLDVQLYNQSGIHGIPLIRQREPEVEIIMYTIHDDYDTILKALCAGATGYLLKDISLEELEENIVSVLEGRGALISPMVAKRILGYFSNRNIILDSHVEKSLSKKENMIVNFLKDGYSYNEISEFMNMSVNGIRYYIKSIYSKLQITSRGELLRKSRT